MFDQSSMESLENRRLMSGTPLPTVIVKPGTRAAQTDVGPGYKGEKSGTIGLLPVKFADGTLTVYGSDSGETIHPVVSRGKLSFEAIRYFADGAFPELGKVTYYDEPTETVIYTTTVAGPPVMGVSVDPNAAFRVPLKSVQKIVLYADGGGDSIDLGRLAIPCEVHGGAGGDTIIGSAANDTLFGEAGDDMISDGRGNDILAGGRGADLLVSRRGPDTLLGGAGDDQLRSYSAESVLNGGAGTDSLRLQAAPDAVTDIEGVDNDSLLAMYSVRVTPVQYSATLRRRGNDLQLRTTVTLPIDEFGVDWDLVRNSDDKVVVSATIYPMKKAGSQQRMTSSRTFDLERTLARGLLNVSIRQGGDTVLHGKTLVTPAFDVKAFIASIHDEAKDDNTITIVQL